MKLLKLLRKKFELLKQNVTIIVLTSKIKLPEKITKLIKKLAPAIVVTICYYHVAYGIKSKSTLYSFA